jgi:hypothetical protein
MVTILPALRQVREDLGEILSRSAVERLCREVGYRWREGPLDPFNTLHLFILQVLHRNTAMTHLPHLSGESFTASAYCQARKRVPLELLKRLADGFAREAGTSNQDYRWRGHRVFLMDGSGFSMPDEPELQAAFGQPSGQRKGCGFPVAHLLAMMNADTGLLRDAVLSPLNTHDMAKASALHPAMSAGDILVADRAFCSYVHLALCLQAHLHAIFRIHQQQIVDFHPHRPSMSEVLGKGLPTSRWVKRLGRCDQLVEWVKPQSCPKWMHAEQFAQLSEKILVRELKVRIRKPGCRVRQVVLVTTLLDPVEYPAAEIARLYGLRWRVEVDLRDIKITLGLDVLKGHSLDVVTKELQVYVLVYNLVRLGMLKAARQQQVHPSRISFIDALRWLQPPKPSQPLPELVVNPERTDRIEPRCLKRRKKQFPYMTRPREELRKRLKRRLDAA